MNTIRLRISRTGLTISNDDWRKLSHETHLYINKHLKMLPLMTLEETEKGLEFQTKDYESYYNFLYWMSVCYDVELI